MSKTHLIIVAAGSGSRFGSPLPKQFCELAGRPVVMHAIDALQRAIANASCAIVLAPDRVEYWYALCEQYHFTSPQVVIGGDTRWQSVKNALDVAPADADLIAIHDGARPLPSQEMILAVINAFNDPKVQGAVPAIAVTDSLRMICNEGSKPIDRSLLRAVQTPQAFRADLLRRAYQMPYQPTFTDDASVMEAAGFTSIALPQGSPDNIKITNPRDIAIAEAILHFSSK